MYVCWGGLAQTILFLIVPNRSPFLDSLRLSIFQCIFPGVPINIKHNPPTKTLEIKSSGKHGSKQVQQFSVFAGLFKAFVFLKCFVCFQEEVTVPRIPSTIC